jgi:periplasmic protein TonB
MNTLEEAPCPVRKAALPKDALELLRPSPVGYVVAAVAALVIHAGILFGWSMGHTYEQIEYGIEVGEESVEVDLVAALPAEEVVETTEAPPDPEPEPEVTPPPPEPVPEPPPEPEKPPEMTLPEPPPVQQPPPPPPTPVKPKPKLPKTEAKPASRVAKVAGDGSAAIPGTASTTQRRSLGGRSSKPGYLRNPHPTYPEEARKLRQQGVVNLRVEVSEQGDPVSVVLSRSSGYPLLDERALTTVRERWKFKAPRVDGVPVRTSVVIPIRFTLE